jgi:ATP-dependent Clp protease protease subunit
MGAFLLAAGQKGKRYALPNSEIMIHQPSAGYKGQVTDIEIHTKRLLFIKDRMNSILAEKTGQPIDIIRQDTERDNFMTAEEALKYGIIDKVMEPKK